MHRNPLAAFLLSLAGGSYQLLSLLIIQVLPQSILVGGTASLYFAYGILNLFVTGVITIWSSSHLHENPEQHVTWASIIVAMALVNIVGMLSIFVYSFNFAYSPYLYVATTLLLIGPVAAWVGGFLGLARIRTSPNVTSA